jgi:alpha-N-arabinofuranosidase
MTPATMNNPAIKALRLTLAPLAGAACLSLSAQTPSASLTLHADQPGPVINKNIYGQFSEHLGHCIYGGIWVGEGSPIPNVRGIRSDVVEALRRIQVPVLRWPGGCFADEYHWKDGIGPRKDRPKMINTNWGGVVEDNSFGTHEFMDLCEQVGCEPYITGNLGSGTVREMMEWVEYMTSDADSPLANERRRNGRAEPWRVKYFAIGNECWGCGGDMTPTFYAENFRRYSVYLKNYPGNRLYRIACGPDAASYGWTDTVMEAAGARMDGLSLHYYTLRNGWSDKGSATDFDEADWMATLVQTLKMDGIIAGHTAIMDRYDPKKRVGLMVDEWGTWYDPAPGTNPGFLEQQNTLRDAIVAALNLHIFQRHADRVAMANIAQMVNVLQAMILTDGPRMVLTPTYHVFEMFKVHQGATFLPVDLTTPDYSMGAARIPSVSASASRGAGGLIHLSLVNTDPNRSVRVACAIAGAQPRSAVGRVLTATTMQAHNTFESPDAVRPAPFSDFVLSPGLLGVTLPAKSVAVLELAP